MMNILSYVTFLESDLIPAQMRISNVIHTTATTKKSNYCQKEEEMKGGREEKGKAEEEELRCCYWYIRFDIIKWSVLVHPEEEL